MILYDMDSTAILAKLFATNPAASIQATFRKLHAMLCAAGHRPTTHWLDNECPKDLQVFLNKESIDFQLVSPSIHQYNAAKRAIQTFKNHFIAGLYSTGKKLSFWNCGIG